MLTIFGIRSCSSCRDAAEWLRAHGIEHRFHDLREDGLDLRTLQRWASRIEWDKLLNRSSLTWRKLPEVDRGAMTENRALATMLEHPTLVKRPVLERDGQVELGFSAPRYREIFGK